MEDRFLQPLAQWQPPHHWRQVTTIDCHTAGEPFRVITGGLPPLKGKTILERRRWWRQNHDRLRTLLMWEPRGHADMYGCIITEPVSAQADLGVLFLHNEGYSTMCGHGIIGLVTVVLETGMLPMTEPETQVRIDTPAGLVNAWGRCRNGRVTSVRFHNVASFAPALDQTVHVPGLGTVNYDLAFGGAFYAFVDADRLGLDTGPGGFGDLIRQGMAIKRAIMETAQVEHPLEPELGFLYGTIFTSAPEGKDVHSRHVCIFAAGEVDRSPTGTGVSARLALVHSRGELEKDQEIIIESIIGTRFSGKIIATTTCGRYPAVIPEIEGSAHITGVHRFVIDPADPLSQGFILR